MVESKLKALVIFYNYEKLSCSAILSKHVCSIWLVLSLLQLFYIQTLQTAMRYVKRQLQQTTQNNHSMWILFVFSFGWFTYTCQGAPPRRHSSGPAWHPQPQWGQKVFRHAFGEDRSATEHAARARRTRYSKSARRMSFRAFSVCPGIYASAANNSSFQVRAGVCMYTRM